MLFLLASNLIVCHSINVNLPAKILIQLRPINMKNKDIYSLMVAIGKIWCELPRSFTPRGWGQKPLFGTDFELWPNISLRWNMISTIGKKLVNQQGLSIHNPKLGELWSRNGWERLASFCPPPKFSHWETPPALPHGRYIADSKQTLARVMNWHELTA